MSPKKQKEKDLLIKSEPPEEHERKDPTSFLPEEPMSYEIKKKKKKKKKKKQEDDPFKDIQERALVTERVAAPEEELDTWIDPEVTIKVENIEVELDFNDFTNNDDMMLEQNNDSEEPAVRYEQQNKDAVLLTFESVINDKKPLELANDNNISIISATEGSMCKFCHLLFKNKKTLLMHQKRKHKVYRRNCMHICDECGMAYEAKNSLVAHIRRRHGPDVDNDVEVRACDECGLVFKGRGRLRMHMRRKHGAFDEAFKHACEDCGLTYEKFSSLLVHKRRKHAGVKKEVIENWVACPFCSKMYRNRETYARHIQRHHHPKDDDGNPEALTAAFNVTNQAGEMSCNQCPSVFSSRMFLKLHLRRKHNALTENFGLKCRICNLSYDKVESLKRHITRKHNQGLYCNECNKQFTTRQRYINHSHVQTIKECTLCGRVFAAQGALAKHLRCTHKIETPKTVFCSICNEGFYDKRQLRPHILKKHYNVTYPCKFCKKILTTKESYRRHILFQHPKSSNTPELVQKCEKCNATFVDEFELCEHVNLAHRDIDIKPDIKTEGEHDSKPNIKTETEHDSESYQCTKCPEKYSTWEMLKSHYEQTHVANTTMCQVCGHQVLQIELQKHMKQMHTENQELVCRFCNFKTNVRFTMTQHTLRHKNATTLNCEYPNCRYKTYYESAMEKHKKKHQENSVRLQCTQCPFQTMNKYVLKYHEEAHNNCKKSYKCDKCEYATNLPANLIQHKYKHSTEKRFKCEMCPFATKYNTSLRFHVKKKHCDLPL